MFFNRRGKKEQWKVMMTAVRLKDDFFSTLDSRGVLSEVSL